MKRAQVVGVLLAALAVAGVLIYSAAAREREYRRLIAEGDAALAADETFLAIEAFSGAIALKPDSMLAHLKRGETYRRRGEPTSALRDLRTAAHLDPAALRPLEELGDVNFGLQRYRRAAEHYDAYLRLDDRSPRLLYKLALARYREGNARDAVTALKQAVALNRQFAEGHYLLGLCLRATRRDEDAVAALQEAVRLAPQLLAAREELAHLYGSLNKRAEQIEQLRILAALEPGKPERQIALGRVYASAQRTDLAVMTLSAAAEANPQQAAIYTALGEVWLRTAEARNDRVALTKALEALQRVATSAAADSAGLTLYARALALSGDIEAADRTLRQAVRTMPIAPEAFLESARVSERLGRLGAARDALIRFDVLAADERDVSARAQQIADWSLRLNQPAVAVEWLQRAVDRAAADPGLLGHLAAAQLRAGNPTAARRTIARGLANDPANRALKALARRAEQYADR